MLTKYVWPLVLSLIMAVIGGLLIVAPFALEYQGAGSAWTTGTLSTLWAGIGLAIIALVTAGLWAGDLAREARHLRGEERPKVAHADAQMQRTDAQDHRVRSVPSSSAPQPRPSGKSGSPAVISDEILASLAAAVLRDLQEQTSQTSWKEGA